MFHDSRSEQVAAGGSVRRVRFEDGNSGSGLMETGLSPGPSRSVENPMNVRRGNIHDAVVGFSNARDVFPKPTRGPGTADVQRLPEVIPAVNIHRECSHYIHAPFHVLES